MTDPFLALLNVKPSIPNVNGHIYSSEVLEELVVQLQRGVPITSERPLSDGVDPRYIIGHTAPVSASFNTLGRIEVQVWLYDKGAVVERIGRELKQRTMVLGVNTIASLGPNGLVLLPINLVSVTPMVPN